MKTPAPLRLPAEGRSTTTSSGTCGPARRARLRALIGVRTGDTPSDERRRMLKTPPDILITTPSRSSCSSPRRRARTLRGIETVILDEVHAVAGTKRGSHMALSLERLEARRGALPAHWFIGHARPLARIGRFVRARAGDRARRRRDTQGARPRGGDPARGCAARLFRGPLVAARRRRADGLGRGAVESFHLALDLSGDSRARPAAPLGDCLRQQPPARGSGSRCA